MRISGRKLLTFGLLAIYGGIAVLGYGLHELSSVHHHHHTAAVHFHDHGHCTGHTHRPGPVPAGTSVGDAHDCEICIFLDQTRSDQPPVVADFTWQHVVAAVTISPPQFDSPTALGPQAPRGPPTLLG